MSGRVWHYNGMRALSPEMAIEDLKDRNHGHVVADGPTEEVLGPI